MRAKKEGRVALARTPSLRIWTTGFITVAGIIAAAMPCLAQEQNAAASAAQNPIANQISIPFQNDIYFGVGPSRQPQNLLLIEPVIPIKLSDEWTLISRSIIPVISQVRLSPLVGPEAGIGNLNPQFYLSPAHPGAIIWGVGPQLWLPTATDRTLGVNKWGGGPDAVVLTIQGHWLFGVLANNVWVGTSGERVNELTLNPFVFYNLPGGWYLFSSPVISANWLANANDVWTLPLGGGFGRVFKIGDQEINARVQGFYDELSGLPEGLPRGTKGPDAQLQTQIQFLF
jgi:hypothetical protein